MARTEAVSATEVLSTIESSLRKEFEAGKRLLSFDEYLTLVGENPEAHTRGSARYLVDMMDHFGKDAVSPDAHSPLYRFHVFDQDQGQLARRVVGQEAVQNHLYRSLKTFAQQGFNNRLLLLHGPNGSAKSSIIQALMAGLEAYSQEPQGALYTINWIFPADRIVKGTMGLGASQADAAYHRASRSQGPVPSYAHLSEEDIQLRLPCEMKDHPLLLVPLEHREAFLTRLVGQERAKRIWAQMPQYLTRGDLCHRCKLVFEALLGSHHGDYRKVLSHVQVERFFHSRRYRKGLATVEPQLHVDAQYQQLTLNKSLGALPASLQSLGLFSVSGDLIDGNRGIIEYSDLLKRPIDSFKYLLIACETGAVNVGSSIAYLDTVMLGSTNEVQLDAFKEFPDFVSFKARIDLVRVPYLLNASQEAEIYEPELTQLKGEKHVAPHVAGTLALWSVLTRLKKPNSINYPPNVSGLISNLSPLDKARLYDTGEVPAGIGAEERKLLRASLKKLREEYNNIPYYEGRMGASAREMKAILYAAAQNPEHACVSPLAVFREMEEFVKRVSEYEFLKQEVKDGYHDAVEFIQTVKTDYIAHIDHEVRESVGLYDNRQWEEFIKKYVLHISLHLKKEKIKNPITGQLESPDFSLVEEFEKIVEVPAEATERDAFRQNIISQVGAWALDHPGTPVAYARVFPEFYKKLEKYYFEQQKSVLSRIHNALLFYDKPVKAGDTEESVRLAQKTIRHMEESLGYCSHCAKEVIGFLMRTKY